MTHLIKVADTIEQATEEFIKAMKKRDELQMIYSGGKFYVEEVGTFVRNWEVMVVGLEKDRIATNINYLTTETRHKIINAFEEKKGVNNAG